MLAATIVALAVVSTTVTDGSNFGVEGDVENAGTWDVERLEKEFADQFRTVEYTTRDGPAKSRCIPLRTFVEKAGPKAKTKRKNPLIGFAVVVHGDDGYAACFGLGDLLPEFGNREVFLAVDRDGKPLPDGDRPARLIIPGESRPARWVFGIERIEIRDMAGEP